MPLRDAATMVARHPAALSDLSLYSPSLVVAAVVEAVRAS
jgi:hypothetical protein